MPKLENFDDDEDHPEAQAQALNDYQLTRDKTRKCVRNLLGMGIHTLCLMHLLLHHV